EWMHKGSLAAMLLLLFYYSKNTIMTLEVYMMEDQEILLLGEQIMGLLSKTDVDLQNNAQQLQICCLNTMNELALRKQANFFDFCEDIVNLICHTISFTFPLHHVGKSMHHLQIHMKRPCIMLVASIWDALEPYMSKRIPSNFPFLLINPEDEKPTWFIHLFFSVRTLLKENKGKHKHLSDFHIDFFSMQTESLRIPA
ncbi:hypothetical protein ACJX0J_017003, partial [Zea mays]